MADTRPLPREVGSGVELPPGLVVAKNYRVVRRMGSGGMGTVYLGENTTLEQRVVIKVLEVGQRGAGAEEARTLASLDHPNVVHVYAYDEEHDCIVMQHLAGKSVWDQLDEMDLLSAVRVVYETALALSAVHERGIVHRDVKPENIMVELKGGEVRWVKLIDLGTALRVGRTLEQPAGTPDYCGPEQFDGTIGASTANDIYALGVTLFMLCTRRFPFYGTPSELAAAHRDAPVPDLVSVFEKARASEAQARQQPVLALEPQAELVLERVGEVVGEMMAKEPSKRPDARKVARRLSELEVSFSREKTEAGFRMVAPIPLTQLAKTSTMALPRLEQKIGPATKQALAGLKKSNRKVYAVIAVGVLLLLLLIGLLMRRGEGGATEVTATAAPVSGDVAGVSDEAPSEAVAAMAGKPVAAGRAATEDELAVLNPRVKAAPRAKPRKVVDQARRWVTLSVGCEPDERWREDAMVTLRELGEIAARSPRKWEAFHHQEDALARAISSATGKVDCGQASRQIGELTDAVLR